MKIIQATVAMLLLTTVLPQPGFAKNATAASKMSGTDAIFGSTSKCHAGRCHVRKTASSQKRQHAIVTKHAAHGAHAMRRPG